MRTRGLVACMVGFALVAVGLISVPVFPACGGDFEKTWGGPLLESVGGLALDASGNIYVSGATESFGSGGRDALLLKYNSAGVLQWSKTWGGTSNDGGKIAKNCSDSIFRAGSTESFGAGMQDVLLLKHDLSGSLLWAKTWGGTSNDQIVESVVDATGNVCCVGNTESYGAGMRDALLLKHDSSGGLLWARTWGGADNDSALGVTVDSTGYIYVTGRTLSFGPGTEAGFFLKFDSLGTLQWARTWGGSVREALYDVVVGPSGDLYVAGWTESFGAGTADALLLKYNSSGTFQWAKTWGGTGKDVPYEMAISSTGEIYTLGWILSFGAGSYDGFVLKYDSSGTFQWAKTWGGSLAEYLYGAVVDSDGSLFLAGRTESYTGVWQTISAGTEANPSGTQTTPSGTVGSPVGSESSPTGTENSPVGSETGGGGVDALLLKTLSPLNTPPTVIITSPVEGASFAPGGDVPITATASDTDGTVTQVEFFQNGTSIGLGTDMGSGTWTITWTSVPEEGYVLTAVATDDMAATTESAPVNILVGTAVTIAASDPNADEAGDPGQFTVTRVGGDQSSDLTVSYTIGGTAENGVDYNESFPLSGTVTIPGGSASATIDIDPVDDGVAEGSETVVLTLVDGASYFLGAATSDTVTISNGEPRTVIVFATDDSAAEDAVAPDPAVFTVYRTASRTYPLDANLTLAGTATEGADYAVIGTSVTIPAGSDFVDVVVTPLDDPDYEGDETVVLTLGAGAYQIAGAGVATAVIADDDPVPGDDGGCASGAPGAGLAFYILIPYLALKRKAARLG